MEYKVTLFGNGIYKEIELPEDMEGSLLIGTTPDCQIRFNRDNFFDDFGDQPDEEESGLDGRPAEIPFISRRSRR